MEPNEGIEQKSDRIVKPKIKSIMSGMSGGHSGGIGGGEMPRPMQGTSDACMDLVIITNLASVDAAVLMKVNVGDVLPVVAQSADGPVVVMKDDEVLGTVLSSKLVQLLNCMNGGTEYEAEVLKIEDAVCQVKISAVK